MFNGMSNVRKFDLYSFAMYYCLFVLYNCLFVFYNCSLYCIISHLYCIIPVLFCISVHMYCICADLYCLIVFIYFLKWSFIWIVSVFIFTFVTMNLIGYYALFKTLEIHCIGSDMGVVVCGN